VLIRQKETQTSLLFQAAQCFSQGSDIPICMTQLNALIIPVLSVELQSILTLDVTKLIDDKERAVLEWAFTNKKTAGWSTDTLPSAQNWYIPLLNQDDLVGVLIVKPLHHQKFLPDEKGLILAIAQQITGFIHRVALEQQSVQTQQLAESEKLYGLILSCISHELKTPMTSILGNLNLLKTAIPTSNEMIEDVENATHRLKRIIDNLLDISRLSSGHMSLHEEWVDLNELLTHSAHPINRFAIRIAPDFPFLWGDPILLERLMDNIISNALHYSPDSGLIRIDATYDSEWVTVSVTDEGPGIPIEFQHTVFQKFFRLPGTLAGGTGLGLAICKEIMDLHKGSIDATFTPPQGTRIRWSLPQRKMTLEEPQ
jgi:two-component system sensor histidine kinase KdpD